jgi:hypothetical protein
MRTLVSSWRRWCGGVLAVALAGAMLAAAPAAQAFYVGDFTTMPAITAAGSSVALAATDAETSDLDYWWEPTGTGDWTEEAVATGISDSPAIAWTGSSVVLTAIGSNGELYYWWQAAGTKTWHQQTVSTMDFTLEGFASRPSIAWTGSSVLITAAASNGWLYYWWQAAGTATWHQELVNDEFNAVPQIAWTGSYAEIVASAPDGRGFNYYWQADGSPTWSSEYEYDPSASFFYPSIAAGSGSAVIASTSGYPPDASLWFGTQASVSSWSLQNVDGTTELSLIDDQAPAIAWNGNSPVFAATGSDGDLYYWFYDDIPSFGLQFWLRLTVAAPAAPAISLGAPAITWVGGAPVIADTNNGTLDVWTPSGSGWSQQAIT